MSVVEAMSLVGGVQGGLLIPMFHNEKPIHGVLNRKTEETRKLFQFIDKSIIKYAKRIESYSIG